MALVSISDIKLILHFILLHHINSIFHPGTDQLMIFSTSSTKLVRELPLLPIRYSGWMKEQAIMIEAMLLKFYSFLRWRSHLAKTWATLRSNIISGRFYFGAMWSYSFPISFSSYPNIFSLMIGCCLSEILLNTLTEFRKGFSEMGAESIKQDKLVLMMQPFSAASVPSLNIR